MLKIKLTPIKALLFTCSLIINQTIYSGMKIGEPTSSLGQLNVGGAIRGKYVYDHDANPSSSKFSFSDVILALNYESATLIGGLDYRLYEYYGHIGDANWLTDAWLGYKINPNHKIIAGLNPVPFGLDRYWGNTFFLGIANVMGLEDIHNIGINYQFKTDKNQLSLAFYPIDGGNFRGHSKDARRFSINMVNADDYVENGTNTQEKNMIIARYAYSSNYADLNYQLGTSVWYSDIENKNYSSTGSRQVWSIFADFNYQSWNSKLLFGHQDIDHKDRLSPDHISLGGFDYSYNSATQGDFFSTEFSYLFPYSFEYVQSIRPYLNISGYINKKNSSTDSYRVIPGVAFKFKDLTIQAEHLIGKYDPYLGDQNGLAQGTNNNWNQKTYISLAYYF